MTELSAGIYEHVITAALQRRLALIDEELVQRDGLDPEDAPELLSRHVALLVRRAIRAVPGDGDERLTHQVEIANQVTDVIARIAPDAVEISEVVDEVRQVLKAIVGRPIAPAPVTFPARPWTALSTGALLVNGRGQPRIGHEVSAEMASADRVDLLCAFITWPGVRIMEGAVRALAERGKHLRIITTTYLGATEQRALDRLAALGAQIRISYETKTTRLHAKAWLFHRLAGATTAYVGSSNLSRSALVDGVEWNVRISAIEQPHVITTFEATFDEYWHDTSFEPYLPDRDGHRLRDALTLERGTRPDDIEFANLDVRPYSYQQEILDELAARRLMHGDWRNLVVMATGTGKTIVAALDYRNLRQAGTVDSLLFVAHQDTILRQSRSVFRHVLRDGTFGEAFVGGDRPASWRHVFASVQSLSRLGPAKLAADSFDMVIVDEFHHAEAPTYAQLLRHLRPKVLVGLTATPERADGQDVLHWFGGRAAVELRLWEALDRGLLTPFQYFGIHDDVDLSTLRWKRGQGYDLAELSNVYTGHHARARIILQALRDKVDVSRMRAIGFCVSIDHADFMAKSFNAAGIPAQAVTSRTDPGSRRSATHALTSGTVRVLFTVDLFNEGVDLPLVDTVLLLRPTQSATIFLQQVGRGLRLADGKACLVVLDFIGAQHAEFRFDQRLRALTGATRRGLVRDVEQDFPTLPAGCHIELDRVAKQLVLDNLRRRLRLRKPQLVAELRSLGDIALADFLAETGQDIEDLYRSSALGGWVGLRRLAGFDDSPPSPDDERLSGAIGRLLHIDDPTRLATLQHIASGEHPGPGRVTSMLVASLARTHPAGAESLRRLHDNAARCDELGQVAAILRARIHRVTRPLQAVPAVPVWLHARYTRDEIRAAFGVVKPVQEGVMWVKPDQADVFFVTLTKTERHYSPTTMYADRAITSTLFQWESQSTTTASSPTGQRYIDHVRRGSTVHLFLRESKERDGDLGAPAYLYAGTMIYQSHSGDKPMRILWELEHPLPADIFHAARVAAG